MVTCLNILLTISSLGIGSAEHVHNYNPNLTCICNLCVMYYCLRGLFNVCVMCYCLRSSFNLDVIIGKGDNSKRLVLVGTCLNVFLTLLVFLFRYEGSFGWNQHLNFSLFNVFFKNFSQIWWRRTSNLDIPNRSNNCVYDSKESPAIIESATSCTR